MEQDRGGQRGKELDEGKVGELFYLKMEREGRTTLAWRQTRKEKRKEKKAWHGRSCL